jgi:hypothetical protein
MNTILRHLGILALLLGLAACASTGSAGGPSCCDAKQDGTAMKCDAKKMSCACCAKSGAEGKAAEGHQH